MPDLEVFEKQFLDTLAELGEDLDKIVIVGGWCPFLYAKYLWHRHLPAMPTTLDIDLGVTETGTKRYPVTVYEKLKKAGFAVERLYPDEAEPIEFVSKKGKSELKLEFITSFLTSDDTLNRFLGKELACNRIEAFEILLASPLVLEIKHGKHPLKLRIPDPATFLFHKGISFVMRGSGYKLGKDLFYVYFILKYHPDRAALLAGLEKLRPHELFDNFRQNLQEYLDDFDQPGYAIIRKFLGRSIDPRTVNKEIKETFTDLFMLLGQEEASL